MFTYCLNNPVCLCDPTGNLAFPGEIHDQVKQRVAKKYNLNTEQRILYNHEKKSDTRRGHMISGSYGRADLISNDGQVWDVKRDKPKQIAAGKKQVEKYVRNTWENNPEIKLQVGKDKIESDSFRYQSGLTTYRVWYRDAGDGVIAYDYKITEFDYEPALSVASAGLAIAYAIYSGDLEAIPQIFNSL